MEVGSAQAGVRRTLERSLDATHLVKTMHALRQAPLAQHFRRNWHGKRVADLAQAVAMAMGLSEAEILSIRRAALLHDVGNVRIPMELLLKPGPLTEEEFQHVKEHVHYSARDVAAVEELQDVVSIVRHHHEWVNGKGYPEGLQREAIPLGSRVVAAADAYVMMRAHVPWRPPKSHQEAIRELCSNAGVQWDEQVVAQLLTILDHYNSGADDYASTQNDG